MNNKQLAITVKDLEEAALRMAFYNQYAEQITSKEYIDTRLNNEWLAFKRGYATYK